jgi:hypothetical protein
MAAIANALRMPGHIARNPISDQTNGVNDDSDGILLPADSSRDRLITLPQVVPVARAV